MGRCDSRPVVGEELYFPQMKASLGFHRWGGDKSETCFRDENSNSDVQRSFLASGDD